MAKLTVKSIGILILIGIISMANGIKVAEIKNSTTQRVHQMGHMSAKKLASVCLVNDMNKKRVLSQNSTKESQEIKNYVPPGDLAKSGNVKNSKNETGEAKASTEDSKGLKVDLEKKFNPYYDGKQEKATGSNPDLPREIQDEGQESGGKFADKIAEENHKELLVKQMTAQQVDEEHKTSFYADAPVFEPTSNLEIDSVINWSKVMSKKYKDNGKEKVIQMGGNTTHQNLLLVYHPQCAHCQKMKDEWINLSQKVAQNKIPINVLSINDGVKDYKKSLPGNLKIDYYPMILLLKNDKDQSVVEFNSENQEIQQGQGQKPASYEYNLNGFAAFLKENQIQGF